MERNTVGHLYTKSVEGNEKKKRITPEKVKKGEKEKQTR